MAIRHLSKTHFDTADAVEMPAGTTAQRPGSPVAGMFRYNTDDNQFEGYTTEWGAIAGSGGGTGQVQNDTFSITTPTTAFTLSITPTNKAHTTVYINGVYQEKSTYSLSGTTLTLSSSAEVGDTVEIESRAALAPTGLTYSNLEFDLFTATAAQTSFTLVNGTPADKSQTLVYIN